MTEKDIRDHINAFLRSKLAGILLPASMGIGLALSACGSSESDTNPDGSGDARVGGGGGAGGMAGMPGGYGGVYAAFGGSNSGGAGGMAGMPGGNGGMYAAFGGSNSGGGGSAGIKGSGGTLYGIGGAFRTGGASGSAGATGGPDSGSDARDGDSTERRDALVSEAGAALEVSSDD